MASFKNRSRITTICAVSFAFTFAACLAFGAYFQLPLLDFVLLSYALLSFKTLGLVATIILMRNRSTLAYRDVRPTKLSRLTPRQVFLFLLVFAFHPFSVWALVQTSTTAPLFSIGLAILILATAWGFLYANWNIIADSKASLRRCRIQRLNVTLVSS